MTDTGDKYADKVDPEFKAAIDFVITQGMMLKLFEPKLQELVDAEQSAHSIGHIINPTLYKDMIYSKRFSIILRMTKAAIAFSREIEACAKALEALAATTTHPEAHPQGASKDATADESQSA